MPSRSLLDARFMASVAQVDELLAIFRFIDLGADIPAKDNILRAALTMLVSTVDTSVHELVIAAILQELVSGRGIFDIGKQIVGIRTTLETDPTLRISLVEADLRKQYSKETFQSSRQLESALSAVGITKIWTKLATRMNQSPETIKLRLDLMVKRRNQIVHEADLDQYHALQQIDLTIVEELYQFTKGLVSSLFDEYGAMN